MVYMLRYKRIGGGFYPPFFLIKESQVVVDKTDEPEFIDHFPDSHGLPGKYYTQIDLRLPMQIRPHYVTRIAYHENECSEGAYTSRKYDSHSY